LGKGRSDFDYGDNDQIRATERPPINNAAPLPTLIVSDARMISVALYTITYGNVKMLHRDAFPCRDNCESLLAERFY
jgi:hypothetical protein